jgi:hypothetical protein
VNITTCARPVRRYGFEFLSGMKSIDAEELFTGPAAAATTPCCETKLGNAKLSRDFRALSGGNASNRVENQVSGSTHA